MICLRPHNQAVCSPCLECQIPAILLGTGAAGLWRQLEVALVVLCIGVWGDRREGIEHFLLLQAAPWLPSACVSTSE